MKNSDSLQILIAVGPEDPHRALLGFACGAAAAASGIEVVVFLVMRGSAWASPSTWGQVNIPGFEGMKDYIDIIEESGGRIEACSTCVGSSCPIPIQKSEVAESVSMGGLTSVAIRMTTTPTVVF